MRQTSILSLALLSALTAGAFAQGSLTPPAGPPAPVFKTLDQVEARTPVTAETCPGSATAVYVISNPGSYYLTGNINGQSGKTAIQINATAVTLDLNGFNLNAAVGSTKGIAVTALIGPVVIRNGILRNWPQQGIQFTNAVEFTIEDVTVYGVSGRGIDTLGAGTIERVSVRGAKDYGIFCDGAPQVVVRDCKVESVTSTGLAVGIHAPNGLVSRCSVATVSGGGASASVAGIHAGSGTVESCNVRGVTQTGSGRVAGIEYADTVTNCTITQITGNGSTASPLEAAGIYLCSTVSNCSVTTVNGNSGHTPAGIAACTNVDHCRVYGINGSVTGSKPPRGISGDQVTDSLVGGVADGYGIWAGHVARCTVRSCENGIGVDSADETGSAIGNVVADCTELGILISERFTVVSGNNVCGTTLSATGRGIVATLDMPYRIENNHVCRWNVGIEIPGTKALVVRNSASANTTNFSIPAGMPVVTATALGTNPNANVSQ